MIMTTKDDSNTDHSCRMDGVAIWVNMTMDVEINDQVDLNDCIDQ